MTIPAGAKNKITKRAAASILALAASAVVAAIVLHHRASPAAEQVAYSCGCTSQPVGRTTSDVAAATTSDVAVPTTSPIPEPNSPAAPSPEAGAPESTTSTTLDDSVARQEARSMVDALVLPPGAEAVSGLAGAIFAGPNQQPACTPLVIDTRYWTVPGQPSSAFDFFASHAPSWIPYTMGATPSGSQTGYGVAGAPTRPGYNAGDELVITIDTVGNQRTGLRVDGIAVPAGSACSSSGPEVGVPAGPVPTTGPGIGSTGPGVGTRQVHGP